MRAQSADAKLVQPAQWLKAGLVPAHFSAEDWEMFVYEYLEDRRAERDARVVAASATPVRTATRAVGVPRILRTEEEPESEGAATAKGAEEPRQPERSSEASEELRHPERSAEGAEPKDPVRRQLGGFRLAPCGILSALRKFDVAASPWFFLLLYNRFDGGESALPAERTNP